MGVASRKRLCLTRLLIAWMAVPDVIDSWRREIPASHERSLWVVTPIPHRAEWSGHHHLGGARASE